MGEAHKPVWLVLPLAVLLLVGCSDSDDDKSPYTVIESGIDCADQSEDAEWSGFGHDLCGTRANGVESAIGADNVDTLEEKWAFDSAGVTSTPVIVDGIAYFGDWAGNVNAVNAKTGDSVWQTRVIKEDPGLAQVEVSGSVVVTDTQVFVGDGSGQLVALDREDGSVQWAEVTDDAGNLKLWGSPIVAEDVVMIGTASFQVFVAATPPFQGSVVGFDTQTGDELWRVSLTEGSGVSVWSSPMIDPTRKTMYVGTGQQYMGDTDYSDSVIAINYETGKMVWHQQFTAGDDFTASVSTGPDHDVGASPNLFYIGERAVLGVADKEGTYYALDRDSGDIIWSTKLTPGGATGGCMSSAAIYDGVIYVNSNDGTSGGGGFGTSGPTASTTFALEADTGDIIWEQSDMANGAYGALTYANGVVYIGTLDGVLHAIDAGNGNILWTETVGNSIGGGVSIADGMLYVGYGWDWVPLSEVPGGLRAFGLP